MPDNEEASFAHPDPDLKPVSLNLWPSDFTNGVVTLSTPSVLRVWSDGKKTNSVSQWDLSEKEMPPAMYIEGYSTGSGDLTLSYNGIVPCSDSVKVTVMKLELTMAEYLGVDLSDPAGKVSSATASSVVEPSGLITNYYWTLTGRTVFTNDVKRTNTIATSMTVYETGEGSTGYKGESINVQLLPSGFSAHTNFTVVKANIDWPGVAETNKETIGAWVQYNGDDDDTNGVIDALQDAMENGIEDDDLVPMELTLRPPNLPTNETVSVISQDCWLDRQKLTNAAGEYTSAKSIQR